MINRLLIANRGEIAVRVARAAREAGIIPLGIYSQADQHAYHLEFMEDSVCVGPPAASQSYLDIERIIAAARSVSADAVHPGYGFLSERAEFAQAVSDAELVFVGPSPAAMRAMGSKIEAKRLVRASGVAVVPGYDGDDQSPRRLKLEAQAIGTPVLIKASAGGGGRGMRVVDDLSQFEEALAAARREAQAAFGNDTVLLERYLRRPRHIEIQILADHYGHIVHFGERECSIQRRHQKIIEEAPSPALDGNLRGEMGAAAVRAAQSVSYTNAGTVEFMLDEGAYYFLEMNTRLQVEHPVTEATYAVDLVQWQLKIAAGEPLTVSQREIAPRGWSMEARLYAEDPANNMLPSSGTITSWKLPNGPGVRVDAGVHEGSDVPVYYDPMLAKIIVWGTSRPSAVHRLERALAQTSVAGVATNIPLLLWISRDAAFASGDTTTQFLSERLDESVFRQTVVSQQGVMLALANALETQERPWRLGRVGIPVRFACGGTVVQFEAHSTGRPFQWEISGDRCGVLEIQKNGERFSITFAGERITGIAEGEKSTIVVHRDGKVERFALAPPPGIASETEGAHAIAGRVSAPMPGKIIAVAVQQGAAVKEHALLVVLEAMKMEHRIEAPAAGNVAAVLVKEGDFVAAGAGLVEVR
ncbi:MAG: acetyl-CoA carboxylase biotin carboxylase subunit [Candidatus Eremiobacteraeota bacterium]|nr:acetyl-CoA carboxylase biotin carboxylase subunit [Candidatus Eremiobacteraeota bacterium]